MSLKEEYTNYILASIRSTNPYTESDTNSAYALGFLSAYLAQLMVRDPLVYRDFKRAMDRRRPYVGPAADNGKSNSNSK